MSVRLALNDWRSGGGELGGGSQTDFGAMHAVVDMVIAEQTLGSVDGGVSFEVGVHVHAVEIHTSRVGSVVPAHHTVRVEQRYELEHKVLAQSLRARVVGVGDEVEESVEDVTGWRFARMHATTDQVNLNKI